MAFDFGQHQEVQSLDSIPEQFRPLYTEKDEGGFRVKNDDATVKGAVEAIIGLNKALKAERGLNKDLKGKQVDLSPLKEYGASVDEIQVGITTKLEELNEQIKGGKQAKIDLDKVKKDIAAAHARETEAKDKRISLLQSQLENTVVNNEALKHLGDAINPDVALGVIQGRVKAVEEDGRLQAFVLDADQTRRYSGVTGVPMTIKELVEEMRASDNYSFLFKSHAERGSQQKPGAAGTKRIQVGRQDRELSPREKINEGLKKLDVK